MLTPTEQLHNLRDSMLTAAAKYADGDIEVRFATPRQVQAINIALHKIVPEAKRRASRVMLLAYIAGRNPRYFRSSKDLTFEEASALIDRLFETTGAEASLIAVPFRAGTVAAIRQAWAELISEEEADDPLDTKIHE